jgi:hypothetical protein
VLVVYAHGYSLTQPQLSDYLVPTINPRYLKYKLMSCILVALPDTRQLALPGNATAQALLDQGYGLVASAYRYSSPYSRLNGPPSCTLNIRFLPFQRARYNDTYRTGGWAVEQALQDLAALTSTGTPPPRIYSTGLLCLRQEEHAVNLYGCDADRTILFGISMGSVIAFSSAERVRCCSAAPLECFSHSTYLVPERVRRGDRGLCGRCRNHGSVRLEPHRQHGLRRRLHGRRGQWYFPLIETRAQERQYFLKMAVGLACSSRWMAGGVGRSSRSGRGH